MAYLYCDSANHEELWKKEFRNPDDVEEYETKYFKGKVKSKFICDRCNKPIEIGDDAVLVQFRGQSWEQEMFSTFIQD